MTGTQWASMTDRWAEWKVARRALSIDQSVTLVHFGAAKQPLCEPAEWSTKYDLATENPTLVTCITCRTRLNGAAR